MEPIFKNDTPLSYLFYTIKCVLGTAACYILYLVFPRYPFYWSIISVLLVLDPDERESMRLAIARMKANIAGAAVGLVAMLAVGRVGLVALCLAVVATLAVCLMSRIGKATRSALAALVIVTMTGNATWITGLYRMICVVAGCLVAIAVTASGSAVLRIVRRGRERAA